MLRRISHSSPLMRGLGSACILILISGIVLIQNRLLLLFMDDQVDAIFLFHYEVYMLYIHYQISVALVQASVHLLLGFM